MEAGETAKIILEGMRSSLKKKIKILKDAIDGFKESGKEPPEDLFTRKEKFEGELKELKS